MKREPPKAMSHSSCSPSDSECLRVATQVHSLSLAHFAPIQLVPVLVLGHVRGPLPQGLCTCSFLCLNTSPVYSHLLQALTHL